MSMQQTIILGILSSTIASIVFYLWMVLIKPRFIISDKICKKRTKDGKIAYMIKVANTTHSFITNVSYSLLYCVEGEDGLKDIKIIEPYKPPLTYMNKYSKANTDYAVRITYLIDENQYPLTDASFLCLHFKLIIRFLMQ